MNKKIKKVIIAGAKHFALQLGDDVMSNLVQNTKLRQNNKNYLTSKTSNK